jgi:hypothetical protein
MQAIATPTSGPSRHAARRRAAARTRGRAAPRRPAHRPPRPLPGGVAQLAAYLDAGGRRRELIALPGRGGSLLVVDRDAATLRDRRLLAHLAADEPPENAQIVCRSYLARPDERRCRPLHAADLLATPPSEAAREPAGARSAAQPIEAGGHVHRLRPVRGARRVPELRWCRRPREHRRCEWEPEGLRDVVAALDGYEPARSITAAAIARHRDDATVSVRQLLGEYRWLCTSPVVLNRAVREAVLRAVERGELSMSEIALRCGVVKRDRQGKRSGETSWLARRVGLMPEGGAERATPWIHSDVLALIAREGLRVSPREVEVP